MEFLESKGTCSSPLGKKGEGKEKGEKLGHFWQVLPRKAGQGRTEGPGVLQSMGWQRVAHNVATEQQRCLLLSPCLMIFLS